MTLPTPYQAPDGGTNFSVQPKIPLSILDSDSVCVQPVDDAVLHSLLFLLESSATQFYGHISALGQFFLFVRTAMR